MDELIYKWKEKVICLLAVIIIFMIIIGFGILISWMVDIFNL